MVTTPEFTSEWPRADETALRLRWTADDEPLCTWRRVMKGAVVMTLFVLGTAAAASAQTSVANRGFIVVNGGYQLTTNDFDDGATFRANAEDGRFTTDYKVKGGPALDIAGGAVLWRRLGVGVGITRFSRSTPTVLTGSVPHPFFFNR